MYSTVIETIKSIPPFDIFVVIFLLYCVFMGAKRGLFLQITSIIALLAGWYISSRYSEDFASYLHLRSVFSGNAARVVTFLVVMFGVSILGKIISGMFIGGVLKEVNRQMGALFGFLKGLIVCLIITYFAVTISSWTRNFILESRSGTMMIKIYGYIEKKIPDNAHTGKIKSAIQDVIDGAGKDGGKKTTKSSAASQISVFKDDIANSFKKAKEKGKSIKKSIDEITELSNNLTNFKNSFSSYNAPQETVNDPILRDASQTPITNESNSSSDSPLQSVTSPELVQSNDSSQDDIFQKADAIFSRNVFRSVSPVDQSDHQTRYSGSSDIYGSSGGGESNRHYTPGY